MVVDGSVGVPLALTRTFNSRGSSSISFGLGGNWRHSYEWYRPDTDETTNSNPPLPTSHPISFPDGRVESFVASPPDIYYRAALGLRERFVQFTGTPKLGYLILANGSKVEFLATLKSRKDGETQIWYYWWNFKAQALIDPFGQRTTLTYNNVFLDRVTEPAGRYLQFYYTTIAGLKLVDHVTASDGRTVQYYYIQSTFPPGTINYVCLDHIVYYGNAQWTAQYTYKGPNVGSVNGAPLLWKCYDPFFGGPMKRIAYTYATVNNPDGTAAVYGQILSENYYDGTNVGAAVSTLSINGSTRTETRGDGTHPTRTFTYTSYKLTSETDFRGVSASKGYDSNYYINSITDRNVHMTDFMVNALNGAVLTATFPATPGDITPVNGPRGVVTNTYGWASCPDVNNRDANNPYYVYSVTDEGGHSTIYTRDTSKRITRIDYADGGYETFSYNSFGQGLSHRLKTGGTETFTYDATGQELTYRDPYHATGNPTARYGYDSSSHLSGVTDALGATQGDIAHTTSYGYNSRGQLTTTTHPTDPIDGQRHTITNAYNPDGTLASTTDELGHVAEFTYDEYKRLRTTKAPQRFTGDTTPRTTSTFYDANGTTDDYTHTDSNMTYVTLPGGERAKTTYDENFRKTAVTVAFGTTDAATASFGYDNVGNVTSVKTPKQQPGQTYQNQSTITAYDERNRVMSITDAVPNSPTNFKYDWSGRKASVTRPNGQIITYDSYDNMNRLLQQTVKQTPNPDAVTKYTYDSAGTDLWSTMQDPRLVALNSTYKYTYNYDQMGRKTSLTYPPDSGNVQRTESWHYDTAGRNDTFTNRDGKIQTAIYDSLNRPRDVSWNDSGLTPTVTILCDAANRVTSVNNTNAIISWTYFNDNLLKDETTTYPGADNTARTVTYTYNADAKRATLQYPNNAYSFTYNYTARNQLWKIINTSGGATLVTNLYDLDGNLSARTPPNSTTSTYTYDVLDRVLNISHALNGTTRTLDYAYDSVSNRKWAKRDSGNADIFGYDLNDQVTGIVLNTSNPGPTPTPAPQTITYDANGNRLTFAVYGGPTDTYLPNNLNQYTSRNSNQATYDTKGNMTTGVDASLYTYDAQNRLLSAIKAPTTETFKYDGLNRQISRTVGAATTYNVYDGWDLIAEYSAGATSPSTAYLSGAGGLVKSLTTDRYYYQDASGSTSHLASNTGALLEWYRYDLQGTPVFYNASNTQISASAYGVRHLFTGQQWYSELGMYDLRNRFYSPDIGRFLQGDPIGFNGDATNLYRYCGNNPLKYSDPSGETVYISQHPVLGIGNHTYLTIVPSDPRNFTGTANLEGRMLTISGQPVGGYLNKTINSDIDSNPTYTRVVEPPPGMTAAQFDQAVYDAAMSYPQDTYSYFFVPEFGGADVYNSNGFIVEMLNEAGVDGQAIVESQPGWQPGSGHPPGGGDGGYVPLWGGGYAPPGTTFHVVGSNVPSSIDFGPNQEAATIYFVDQDGNTLPFVNPVGQPNPHDPSVAAERDDPYSDFNTGFWAMRHGREHWFKPRPHSGGSRMPVSGR